MSTQLEQLLATMPEAEPDTKLLNEYIKDLPTFEHLAVSTADNLHRASDNVLRIWIEVLTSRYNAIYSNVMVHREQLLVNITEVPQDTLYAYKVEQETLKLLSNWITSLTKSIEDELAKREETHTTIAEDPDHILQALEVENQRLNTLSNPFIQHFEEKRQRLLRDERQALLQFGFRSYEIDALQDPRTTREERAAIMNGVANLMPLGDAQPLRKRRVLPTGISSEATG